MFAGFFVLFHCPYFIPFFKAHLTSGAGDGF